MRAAVIVYPGSNCDRDLARALIQAGAAVEMVWHKETSLPKGIDFVALPGGFSFGDYLRCGAIAARAPITRAVVDFANSGGYVLGVCNGFQILCETGLLPGALMRNAGLRFVCRNVTLSVESADNPFFSRYDKAQEIVIPIAHHDGNYVIDGEQAEDLAKQERIALRYVDNPNGSMKNIAGVLSENRRILGMMPHPERAIDARQGSADGLAMFRSVIDSFVIA